MADLKFDLLSKLRTDKSFEELELVRLAQDPNMNYRDKIDSMAYRLERLAILNAQTGLVEQYFQAPPQVVPAQVTPEGTPVVQKPAGVVHPNQTHGE
jgi:hypothetical protein